LWAQHVFRGRGSDESRRNHHRQQRNRPKSWTPNPAACGLSPIAGQREVRMRVMIKFAIPVAAGNDAIRSGKLQKVFRQIHEDLKPEAAYFYPEAGERTGHFVVNMTDSSDVAGIAEKFFFGLDARIEMMPVMAADDLEKALAGLEETIRRYG
jgi:hypothetical protein